MSSLWMSLTRYDGWFLIPFIALAIALAAEKRKFNLFMAFGVLSALAPLYWLGHDWWETGNPLDFYNGPYSAAAIQAYKPYPGLHDWPAAIHYYWEAGRACSGNGLLLVGVFGLLAAVWKGQWLAVGLLSLTPVFYVLSVHGSWTPIYLPWLWPHGYYNSRYGLAVVVLMAFAAGALVAAFSRRSRWPAYVIPLIAILPWIIHPTKENWICWKESQRNSDSRRAWTAHAAAYLTNHYQLGDGVLMQFGDLTGIFCKAGLPLKEALHEGNGPAWFANTMPDGLVEQTKWAIAQQDSKLAKRLAEAKSYQVVKSIQVEGAPALLIYRRTSFPSQTP